MAPLTWRNVDAPNFGPAAYMLNHAVQNFTNAAGNVGSGLTRIGELQRRDASAAAMPILARVANEQGVDAALGQVENLVAPRHRSPELLQAMANLRGVAQGYEQGRADLAGTQARTDFTRAGTQSALGRESRDAENHSRQVRAEDQLNALAPDILRAVAGGNGGGSPVAGPANPNVSPDFAQHIPGIFAGESQGDYDALFNFSNRDGKQFSGTKLTEMSVDEAIQFANPRGEYAQYVAANNKGRVATPMGAYQVVGSTLGDAKRGLGLKGDEKMTPELQDRIGEWVFRNQGLGAWVGYKPQGAGSAPAGGGAAQVLTELADRLSGQGNAVGARQVLELVNSGLAAVDGDRDRDYRFSRDVITASRNDAEFERGEEARRLGEEAREWVNEGLSRIANPSEAVNAILSDPEASAPQKRARLLALREVAEENPEFFGPISGTGMQAEIALALEEVGSNQDYFRATNPDPLAGSAGRSGGGSGGGRGSGGAGGEAGTVGDTALQTLGNINSVPGVQLDTSTGEAADIINRVMRETGLPREVVERAALNSVSGGGIGGAIADLAGGTMLDPLGLSTRLFGGQSRINEDLLRYNLRNAISPEARQQAEGVRIQRELDAASVQALASEDAELARVEAVLSQRQDPRNAERLQQIRERRAQIKAEVLGLVEALRINPRAGSGGSAAPAAGSGPAAERIRRAAQDNGFPDILGVP